jgi:DNA-3-methyladenine glycosylase
MHNQELIMASLKSEFFARDTVTVARELIGATMIVGDCAGRIVETEAYTIDAASHSVTRRNQAAVMRETFGHIYVYLIYGMYYCLNFTSDRTGPGAVLIRAVEPTAGIDLMMTRRRTTEVLKLASGPGRLTEALAIDLRVNGKRLGKEIKLRARAGEPEISASPRIGITRALDLEWRFYETGNPFVSGSKRR